MKLNTNIVPIRPLKEPKKNYIQFHNFYDKQSIRLSRMLGFKGLPMVQNTLINSKQVIDVPLSVVTKITQDGLQEITRQQAPFTLLYDLNDEALHGSYAILFFYHGKYSIPYQIWDQNKNIVYTKPEDIAKLLNLKSSQLVAAFGAFLNEVNYTYNGLDSNKHLEFYIKSQYNVSDEESYTLFVSSNNPDLVSRSNIIL